MAGLTNTGLTINRLPDVIDELSQEATTIFQDLVTPGDSVDTSAKTTIGRIIGTVSPSFSDLWEAVQQVYSSFDPNSAYGVALDNLVALGGLTRNEPVSTTCKVTLSGTYNTLIPATSVVSSSFTGSSYDTLQDTTLNGSGAILASFSVNTITNSGVYTITFTDGLTSRTITYTADGSATAAEILNGLQDYATTHFGSVITATIVDISNIQISSSNVFTSYTFTKSSNLSFYKISKLVDVQNQVPGPFEQNIGTIDTISTPVLGWDTVSNPVAAEIGNYLETDEELRLRFRDSKFVRGSNILDALYSDLVSLQGVDKVIILENKTSSTDGNGLVAKSFMAIVKGGLDQEIGDVIWADKPTGIQTNGNTTVTVKDIQEIDQTVYFQRPPITTVYVTVNVSITGSDFPPDGIAQIQSAVLNYVNNGLTLGDDVIYSRLYTPVNSIPGHTVNYIHLGTSASPSGTSNIAIAFDHEASLELANCIVTVT